jgi:predicted dehydrogenase
VDRGMSADLSFADGRTARLQCDMLSPALFRSFLAVRGEAGSLAVFNPYHPHIFNLLTVRGLRGRRFEHVRGENAYVLQLRAFIAAIQGKAALNTDPADAIGNMRLIDAIYEKAGMMRRGDAVR